MRYRRPISFIYAILCFHSLIIIIMLLVPVEFVIAELSWIDFSYIPIFLHDGFDFCLSWIEERDEEATS